MYERSETKNSTDKKDLESKSEHELSQNNNKNKIAIENGTHTLEEDHLRDNVEFIDGIDKTNDKEKAAILENIKKWQEDGDIDLLRAAGLSWEQIKNNPLDRHIRLASSLLERDKTQKGLVFRLNLHGRDSLQWDLDLTDILPPNNLVVDLFDNNGNPICIGAIRDFKENKPGYFNKDTGKRIFMMDGMKIKISKSQSSFAIKSPIYGHQASLQASREESFMLKNAQKTVIKKHASSEAEKIGKKISTDKSFFDIFLESIVDEANSTSSTNFKNPLEINFKKLEQSITKLLESFGFMKILSGLKEIITEQNEKADDKSKVSKKTKSIVSYSETHESENIPKINRQWLKQYVGENEHEVQKKLVPINFLGANIRVCKFIAPYLKEAEIRARQAGIDYQADQKQTSCFNWRPIRGGSETLSMHSWGVAIDINASRNPWQPELRKNKNNRQNVKTDMPPELIAIMRDVGFMHLWWDPMHFELSKNPFLNKSVLKSAEARALGEQYLKNN